MSEYTNVLQSSMSLLCIIRWSVISQIDRSRETELPSLELPSQSLYGHWELKKQSHQEFFLVLLPVIADWCPWQLFLGTYLLNPPNTEATRNVTVFLSCFAGGRKKGKCVSWVESKVNLSINKKKYISICSIIVLLLCKCQIYVLENESTSCLWLETDQSMLHKLLGLSISMVEWYLLWHVGFAATVFEHFVELNRILLTVLKWWDFLKQMKHNGFA